MFINKETFKKEFKRKLSNMFGTSLSDASTADLYASLASLIRDTINERWIQTNNTYLQNTARQVYYFSLEFLLGQSLESNLISLGVRDVAEEGLKELGIDLHTLADAEPDAGLGNGGLGRLAACFLDSIASLSLAGHGCGIRYKNGLFSQKIVNGYQVELPDNWLRDENAWEIKKPDKAVIVKLGGNVYPETMPDGSLFFHHENALEVRAVPYDMPIIGYSTNTVNTLRLWSAESTQDEFDFQSFSRGDHVNAISNRYAVEAISEVLYPDDSNYSNRLLRLKQQYFFVSAGLQSIVRRYRKKGNDILELNNHICIQINDTHPALAVPELMRILLDDFKLDWDTAWSLTTRTIAYTNHTIMPEALEKWPVDTFKELLPRIYMIVEEINRRFCGELMWAYPNDEPRVTRMSIIGDGVVKMAHLAIVGSFSVNGVAEVHTELLKTEVLKDFFGHYPYKFNNKTNGITHRRWLIKSNPLLTNLLNETIGQDWIQNPSKLNDFARYAEDSSVLNRLAEIKLHNKERLADYLKAKSGFELDPNSIFDVQVKRIHAYKRQLMNLIHILYLYNRIKDGFNIGAPRTFLMAGKAAPSYYYAKNVIKLANEISSLISNDPDCKGKLSLFFLENYNVGMAEMIFPASDVSEQISTASKEASGTSNMKFMMNGAITIGTNDGANIEIRQNVGDDNFVLFGLSVKEVLNYYARSDYNSRKVYQADQRLIRIIDMIQNGLGRTSASEFANVVRSLLDYNDEFFVLRDFDGYVNAHDKIVKYYHTPAVWNKMSLMNIAKSGSFSSDNTISQYARDIWKISPVDVKLLED